MGRSAAYRQWQVYGGTNDGLHFSALNQINKKNVQRLTTAWTYETGDAFDGSEMECNPIVIDGVLYATTPKVRVIALDAATGKLRWSFDPRSRSDRVSKARSRGLNYWTDGREKRLFFAFQHRLYALDATHGQLVQSFGQNGTVDLRHQHARTIHGRN